VDAARRDFFMPLWNTYRFFVTYAKIDGWRPQDNAPRLAEMDRWILSRLQGMAKEVTEGLEEYEPRRCTEALQKFVSDLSRWYLRTSRRRFWKNEADDDKEAAYFTLHRCLEALILLIAPFTPFMAEEMYQNIVRSVEGDSHVSVHHNPWPIVEESLLDMDLEQSMTTARSIVELGRSLRNRSGVKLRQPLGSAVIVCDTDSLAGLESLVPILEGELNVSVLHLSTVEKPGYEYLREEGLAVGIDLHIDEDLRLEGLSREIVRVIQSTRI
jgi:isoleucyl-tRNA synthetase